MNDFLPARVEPRREVVHGSQVYEAGPVPAAAGARGKRLFTFLLKYWWVPFLTMALAVGGAVACIAWMPPVFVSTGRMWETEKMRLPEGSGFTQDLQNYLGTQMELLRSEKLRGLALNRLRAQGTNTVPAGRWGRPLDVRIRVAQAPKTAVLEVDALSANPEYAQAFLNCLMDEYLEYKKSVRKSVSGDTLASISEQALRLERELKADQDALTAFQRTNNLAILEEEGRIAGGYLARLKTQLSDLALESQLLEATALERDWAGGTGTNNTGLLLSPLAGSGASTPSPFATERQAALRELELLKIQREKLSKFLRPKHPKMVKLEADIERGEKLIELYRGQSMDELNKARQALKMRTESVTSSTKEWEAKVVEANSRIAEAERLKLNVNRTQSLYDRLAILLQNVDVSRNLDRETLAILEPASRAERSRVRDLMVLALALAVGFSAGLGIVLVVEARDDRFGSPEDVDAKFGDSIVGQVPELRKLPRNKPLPLLEQNDPRDVFAEAYRNLRSALLFLPVEGPRPKLMLVTSAVPNEGKSTVTANLARALALGGSRVLLVDGDMRKGQLHRMLELQREPGFSDLLADPRLAPKCVQKDSLSNLSFIGCGTRRPNPGDLLLSPELDRLFAEWREQFDYVLVDSSPVFAAADVTSLAQKVDGTLFVVRRRFSSESEVREAIELLLRRQGKVLGLIFNRANASARSYHYYKYADYHVSAK